MPYQTVPEEDTQKDEIRREKKGGGVTTEWRRNVTEPVQIVSH